MENDLKLKLEYLRFTNLLEQWDNFQKQAQKNQPSYYNYLKDIIDCEYNARTEKARLARIKRAKIPEVYELETFPFDKQPKLDKKIVYELYDSMSFIKDVQDLIYVGPTGCGKTGLSVSFLVHSINKGYRGLFIDFSDLINILYQSRGDHTEERVLRYFTGFDVLLIDELGYICCKKEQASLFFDLMRRRHKKSTTIITTQLGFNEWPSFLQNDHLVAALLDRMTSNCVVFNMKDCISIREKKIVFVTNK